MKRSSSLVLMPVLCLGFATLGLGGCSRDLPPAQPSSAPQAMAQQQQQAAPSPSLDGLTTQEVLMEKYDSAKLDCTVNFPTTVQLDGGSVSYQGTGSVTWDLLKDYADTKSLQVEVTSGGVTVQTQISVNQIEILANLGLAVGNHSWALRYTPRLRAQAVTTTESPINVGSGSISIQSTTPFELYENIPPSLTATSSGKTDQFEYQLSVKCQLNTQLKSEFQDQWKQVQ